MCWTQNCSDLTNSFFPSQFSKAILQEYDRQPEKGGSFNQPFLKASGSQLSYPSRDSGPACEEKLLLFWRVGDQLYCVSKQYG